MVEAVCRAHGVDIRFYPVGADLRPKTLQTEEGEWFYLVNFYGQLTADELNRIAGHVPRLIVDNAQAYFDLPLEGVDTLYTCRKFLGVADGGFVYTDAPARALPADESRERMGFVLGRFERPAGAPGGRILCRRRAEQRRALHGAETHVRPDGKPPARGGL